MQLYLGLDMATHNSGVALLSEDLQLVDHINIYGGNGWIYERCKHIYDQLDEYLSNHKDIIHVALEDTLLNKWVPNLNSCRDLITLKGWVQACIHKHGLDTTVWTANEWKAKVGILTGPEGKTRAAQKQRSIRLVKDRYGIDVDDNQSDAICLALSEIMYQLDITI